MVNIGAPMSKMFCDNDDSFSFVNDRKNTNEKDNTLASSSDKGVQHAYPLSPTQLPNPTQLRSQNIIQGITRQLIRCLERMGVGIGQRRRSRMPCAGLYRPNVHPGGDLQGAEGVAETVGREVL